jgi:hypothetical protein
LLLLRYFQLNDAGFAYANANANVGDACSDADMLLLDAFDALAYADASDANDGFHC